MGMDEAMKFMVEKLKEAPLALENLGVEAKAGFDKVSPPETRRDIINHWKVSLENSGGEAVAWFDKVFPPETRADKINHWLHVAQPYLIAAMALTVVVWFCRSCCGCCRSRGGGGWVKMMKAPGRNMRMPRHVFEADPKGYFLNLRAHK